MTRPLDITGESFDREVLQSEVPVLVDFWAAWCAPCKMIAPLLEELAREYGERAKFVKLDVDTDPHTAGAFGVRSVPTLMMFSGGTVRESIVGVRGRDELAALLDRYVTT